MTLQLICECGGWPIQARCWLEWGTSTTGESLPAALQRNPRRKSGHRDVPRYAHPRVPQVTLRGDRHHRRSRRLL